LKVTYSIRYRNPRPDGAAGLAIAFDESQVEVIKSRLASDGCTMIEVAPLLHEPPPRPPARH
jgi:hypothetical protein